MDKLKSLEKLEECLSRLPSIGKRSAERMAFSMLDMKDEDLNELADAISSLKEKIHICPRCGHLTENDICDICSDDTRDRDILLVVSTSKDVFSFEKSEGYHGLYHVLGGTISLGKGKGIEDLNIPSLISRVEKENIKEVIIATNPTVDGETTALYIAKLLENMPVQVTRIAYGLPMGGNLEYTDSLTLNKALEGRRKI